MASAGIKRWASKRADGHDETSALLLLLLLVRTLRLILPVCYVLCGAVASGGSGGGGLSSAFTFHSVERTQDAEAAAAGAGAGGRRLNGGDRPTERGRE